MRNLSGERNLDLLKQGGRKRAAGQLIEAGNLLWQAWGFVREDACFDGGGAIRGNDDLAVLIWSAANRSHSCCPCASAPTTPIGTAVLPSATMLRAGLAAPPKIQVRCSSSSTGIGASRERRVGRPNRYSSNVKSPTTSTRSPCKRATWGVQLRRRRQQSGASLR